MNNIGFIGSGNMSRSIIGGLIQRGTPAENIYASDLSEQALDNLKEIHAINISTDNSEIAKRCDTLVLAVKPQVIKAVCTALAKDLGAEVLVISIAAGVTCEQLKSWLNGHANIIRCMPNTPALIQQGASGLYAHTSIKPEYRQRCEDILNAVGITHWVDNEDLIDPVTAVSGSGPAYFFYFLEGMIEAGVQQGLDPQTARALAIQTAKGAATLAQQSDDELSELRRKVTSPGGTTEQAIQSFEQSDLKGIILKAMDACVLRSRELAKQG